MEATRARVFDEVEPVVSIHASVMEATPGRNFGILPMACFDPRLRDGGDD